MTPKYQIVFQGKAREVLPRIMYLLSQQKNVTLVQIRELQDLANKRERE